MNYNISEYIIRDYILYGEIFIDGKKDFENGKVYNIKNTDFYEKIVSAEVDGERGKKYLAKAYFDDNGNIEKTVCTCCFEKCRHIAALLFCILNSDTIIKDEVFEIDGITAFNKILDDFEKVNFKYKNFRVKKNVAIRTIFRFIEDNKCCIDFYIGKSNYVKIQNIYEFVRNFEKNDVVKNCDKSFRKQEFTEEAYIYIDFIKKQIQNYNDFSKDEKIVFDDENFVLSRHGIDDFFDIVCDKEIIGIIDLESEDGKQKFNLKFTDDYFDYSLYLKKDKSNFKLVGEEKDLKLIEGINYGYILENEKLFRVPKERFDVIKAINEAFVFINSYEMKFPFDYNEKFINKILAVLEKQNVLKNKDEAYEILNISEPHFEFYLDCDKKKILLELVADYDKINVFNLFFENKIEEKLFEFGFEYFYGMFYTISDEEKIFEFYNGKAEELKKFGEVFVTDEFKKNKVKVYKNTLRSVNVNGGLLEINFDLEDFNFDEIDDIINAYRIKKKYFRLKDGSFIDFQNSSLEPVLDIIDGFGFSKDELKGENKIVMPVYNAIYLNEIVTKGKYNIETNDVFDEIIKKFKMAENHEFVIPKSLDGILRDYQKKGFCWLEALTTLNFGGILADDMGLGKTLQMISVILAQPTELPTIIICPSSLIYNWKSEFEKFAPSVESVVVAGAPKLRKEILSKKDFKGVFITTYDILKRDIDCYSDFYFKFIVVDEAQNIKNAFTQNAKTVKMLMGDVRFALTGTPIENSLSELWSIFDFIMPGYLGNKRHFQKMFENPIVKYNDTSVFERLRKKIKPFILRRIKKDVLTELPEKSEIILYCDMEEKQRKLYNANFIKAKNNIEQFISLGEFEKEKIKILSYITRLRQLCCHPSLFVEEYDGGSGKLEIAVETIRNILASGHRILLFSQFASMLNIIKDELQKEEISFFYLDGKTSSEDRIDMTNRFNFGEKEVFLISLKAGGTGLNLIGADVVIHFDPWWNPAVMEQASDRAYRFGQIKNVQVFYLVAKNSIEEKIIALQEKKKELIKSVISDSDEMGIGKMTKEEILDIFKE